MFNTRNIENIPKSIISNDQNFQIKKKKQYTKEKKFILQEILKVFSKIFNN